MPHLAPFERHRRVPGERWFKLIGVVGNDGTPFPIGTGRDVTMSATGRLYRFANDVSWAYWNNWGKVMLTIERVTQT
jgi:hypothetical protein